MSSKCATCSAITWRSAPCAHWPVAMRPADLAAEGVVVEHVQVGVEERRAPAARGRRRASRRAPRCRAHVRERRVRRARARRRRPRRRGRAPHRDSPAEHHARRCRGRRRRAGHAVEARVGALGARRARPCLVARAGGLGVGDDAGELRRQRDQERLLRLVEAARGLLLHDQHAEDATLMDDRHAEEGVERLLADLGQVVIGRVRDARSRD